MPKLKKSGSSPMKDELAEVVDTIQEENNEIPESDIKVNDNGESEEFELPAGYVDDDGTLHSTFVIREMNGKDEEAIRQSINATNSAKTINVLLARCIVRIGTLYKKDFKPKDWENIIRKLYVGDQDYILLKIRELSLGKEIECGHRCPFCKAQITTYVDTDEFEMIPFDGERVIDFELPRGGYTDARGNEYYKGKMRLPNGYDREILTPKAKKNIGVANTLMLTRLTKFDNGKPTTEDVIRNLKVKDREYMFELMNEHTFGPKTTVEVECPECGEEFTGNLNATNFI